MDIGHCKSWQKSFQIAISLKSHRIAWKPFCCNLNFILFTEDLDASPLKQNLQMFRVQKGISIHKKDLYSHPSRLFRTLMLKKWSRLTYHSEKSIQQQGRDGGSPFLSSSSSARQNHIYQRKDVNHYNADSLQILYRNITGFQSQVGNTIIYGLHMTVLIDYGKSTVRKNCKTISHCRMFSKANIAPSVKTALCCVAAISRHVTSDGWSSARSYFWYSHIHTMKRHWGHVTLMCLTTEIKW